ncbi:MAG: DsrE family protein [Pseudomonadota bacterium]
MTGLAAKPVGLAFCRGPHDGADARERLDLALALAAADWPLSLFFLGPGVQLLRRPAVTDELRDFPAALGTLVMFGVEQIFAEASALERYELAVDDLRISAKAISSAELRSAMDELSCLT